MWAEDAGLQEIYHPHLHTPQPSLRILIAAQLLGSARQWDPGSSHSLPSYPLPRQPLIGNIFLCLLTVSSSDYQIVELSNASPQCLCQPAPA